MMSSLQTFNIVISFKEKIMFITLEDMIFIGNMETGHPLGQRRLTHWHKRLLTCRIAFLPFRFASKRPSLFGRLILPVEKIHFSGALTSGTVT